MTLVRENELVEWGIGVGELIEPPIFLLLRGPLGAGKSVLARSIAQGVGVKGPVTSPTFNLLITYPSFRGHQVVHVDLYRLSDPKDLWELGWEDLGSDDQIVIIEWPERAEAFLPRDRWEIRLGFVNNDELVRTVLVEKHGDPASIPDLPSSAT